MWDLFGTFFSFFAQQVSCYGRKCASEVEYFVLGSSPNAEPRSLLRFRPSRFFYTFQLKPKPTSNIIGTNTQRQGDRQDEMKPTSREAPLTLLPMA